MAYHLPRQTQRHWRARLVLRLRKGIAVLYGAYAWLLFSLLVPAASLLIMLLRDLSQRRRIARSAARLLFFLAGMPLQLKHERGQECTSDDLYLPDVPHIMVVNHSSFLDGIALTALLPAKPGYAFVVRREFLRQSVFCPLLQAMGVIVMTHHSASHPHANVDRIVAALRAGKNVLLFPEGGFQPGTGVQDFHTGAFAAAAEANAPIVCAGLCGARSALPPRSWCAHRSAITLEIGPVLFAPGTALNNLISMSDEARTHVARLAHEPKLTSGDASAIAFNAAPAHQE